MVIFPPHPLKHWLHLRHCRHGVAAKELKVSEATVCRWFRGMREMRLELKKAVEVWTQGQVTRRDIEDWQANHLARLETRENSQQLEASL